MTNVLDTTLADAQTPARRNVLPRERAACFHCGEACPDDSFAKGGRTFCCHGCLTVHDLLTESGLSQFYDLSEKPGVRARDSTTREQFAYLNEPELQQRLLDFTDGRISHITLHVPAIHCIACVWLLENLFRLHAGIGRSCVDFPKRAVAITFDPGKIKLGDLVALLTSIGYEPALTLGETENRRTNPGRKRQWLQVGIAGFAFGNIMLFSLPMYFGLDSFSGPLFRNLFGWLSLAFATPVLLYSASDYWRSALLSVRQRMLTLDLPIALGLAALYGQSAFEIATGRGAGYCDSLTGLIFFLLCGRVFQQKTHERLVFNRDYKSFFPLSVTRKNRASGSLTASQTQANHGAHGSARPAGEERVSLSQLQVGDQIILRNGELIPADARLLSSDALIDYGFITGESEPVEKRKGEYLYAGGRQIGAAIELETVKPVSQSHLASLWNHETFQKDAGDNFNSLTNRYSRWFTFAVVGTALAATLFWIVWGDLLRGFKAFVSVLIVACPCALALAAPFALGTAQRWLARISVFLKNALVLERMVRVDTVVFDKTGTLTAAGINAVRFHGANLSETEESWLFSLTRHSTHPHAAAINESFANRYYPEPVRSFLETPGCGIEGQVEEHEIWLGSRAWLESHDVKLEPTAGLPTHGSIVYLAVDGRHRGAFVLSAELRAATDRLIRRLGRQYELALLSGDNERERDRFRALFGDDARLNFNQSPLDKLGFIRRLQASGKTVMMVGDGLNDAGALKQSDVGVAVVEKLGAFSPASDVILDATRVPQLSEMLTLARRAARIVKISLGISAACNIAGVSIAAAGLLSPLTCAVLMPISSVSVVLFACGMTTWAARRSGLKSGAPRGVLEHGQTQPK